MLTGPIRNDIDKLWEKFWTGGITNPLTVIEQISYLMFARMLDMQEEAEERKANRTGKAFTRLFPDTKEGQLLRWKNFKNLPGKELHKHLKNEVYPYFSKLGEVADIDPTEENTPTKALGHISDYMEDADLEIKNESVLVAALEMVNALPLNQSDVKGDIYEYLLSKLTTAGINGQFRTPRHIIDAMIEITDPQPYDTICDPSCGTAGFLARTMEYLNRQHTSPEAIWTDEEGNPHYPGDKLENYREHISDDMFWGFDFDTTMLRVSSMNMMLHGVNGSNVLYQDTLNKSIRDNFPAQEENFFDVILANPPFKGSLDESNTNPELLSMVKTKKTELLFVAHILRSLKLGGRAAVIVPDGVLFGSSKAHQQLRQELIENNQLEGIISLPSGVFKPYAGVSTAILLFTKGGTTERVWFYDLQADGYSLDDKRTPLKGDNANDLPDAIAQWKAYRQLVESNATPEQIQQQFGNDAQGCANPENAGAYFQDKTQKADVQGSTNAASAGRAGAAFVVDAAEIASNKYDLSINRYKKVVYEEEVYEDPKVILNTLMALENDIMADLKELEEML